LCDIIIIIILLSHSNLSGRSQFSGSQSFSLSHSNLSGRSQFSASQFFSLPHSNLSGQQEEGEKNGKVSLTMRKRSRLRAMSKEGTPPLGRSASRTLNPPVREKNGNVSLTKRGRERDWEGTPPLGRSVSRTPVRGRSASRASAVVFRQWRCDNNIIIIIISHNDPQYNINQSRNSLSPALSVTHQGQ